MSDVDDGPDELIQEWSKDKLRLLAQYLRAYSVIMQTQREKEGWLRSYSYVDAFASVGAYRDAETAELVKGSPLVALHCEPPFDEYWFIERAPERMDRLKGLLAGEAECRSIRYVVGDSNQVLQQQVARAIRYENFNRGFVFLDPYGFHVEWETIQCLAEARAFDVFVNFPIMGVNRVLERRRKPSGATLDLLRRVMGRADWAATLYETQFGLFGEERTSRARLRAERLAELYIGDIRKLFGYASTPVVMRNSTNTPLYALFLASGNRTAVKITNDIFRRYERLGK